MTTRPIDTSGLRHIPGVLDRAQQEQLVQVISDVIKDAPLYVPEMPKTGRPLSVRMTNCGTLGWVTCRNLGYRYQATHPQTDMRWPPIPESILSLWRELVGTQTTPEACLINWYEPDAKLGLHVDRDEREFDVPVLSLSLGDDAWFRIGGLKRRDPTERLLLKSGDAIVLGGKSRLIHHGVDRILPGTSDLLPAPGRFNLTLRRVEPV